ncbi:U1 snRNP-associated protein usp107 [Elsinoe australis]|uniref:U1 snRNP-associated protein usp107 n=1 Tax=Elsinoe australis TaxID=40998 RepID=A0A2P8A3X0_9PEZI|nr:U1 snRNP-associated protein usp107 [Elsinoe australis]
MGLSIKVIPPPEPSFTPAFGKFRKAEARQFILPVKDDEKFESVWRRAEERYVKNYYEGQQKDWQIRKIVTSGDDAFDIDLSDTVGDIFDSSHQGPRVVHILLAPLNRELSVPFNSRLRIGGQKRELTELQRTDSKRRRLEEQRYGGTLDELSPDHPVPSRERNAVSTLVDEEGFVVPFAVHHSTRAESSARVTSADHAQIPDTQYSLRSSPQREREREVEDNIPADGPDLRSSDAQQARLPGRSDRNSVHTPNRGNDPLSSNRNLQSGDRKTLSSSRPLTERHKMFKLPAKSPHSKTQDGSAVVQKPAPPKDSFSPARARKPATTPDARATQAQKGPHPVTTAALNALNGMDYDYSTQTEVNLPSPPVAGLQAISHDLDDVTEPGSQQVPHIAAVNVPNTVGRAPWTKEERRVVADAVSEGLGYKEIFDKNLLPGRSLKSLKHSVQAHKSESKQESKRQHPHPTQSAKVIPGVSENQETWTKVDLENIRISLSHEMGAPEIHTKYFSHRPLQSVKTKVAEVKHTIVAERDHKRKADYRKARIVSEERDGRPSSSPEEPYSQEEEDLLLAARILHLDLEHVADRYFPRRQAADVKKRSKRVYARAERNAGMLHKGVELTTDLVRVSLGFETLKHLSPIFERLDKDRKEFSLDRTREWAEKEQFMRKEEVHKHNYRNAKVRQERQVSSLSSQECRKRKAEDAAVARSEEDRRNRAEYNKQMDLWERHCQQAKERGDPPPPRPPAPVASSIGLNIDVVDSSSVQPDSKPLPAHPSSSDLIRTSQQPTSAQRSPANAKDASLVNHGPSEPREDHDSSALLSSSAWSRWPLATQEFMGLATTSEDSKRAGIRPHSSSALRSTAVNPIMQAGGAPTETPHRPSKALPMETPDKPTKPTPARPSAQKTAVAGPSSASKPKKDANIPAMLDHMASTMPETAKKPTRSATQITNSVAKPKATTTPVKTDAKTRSQHQTPPQSSKSGGKMPVQTGSTSAGKEPVIVIPRPDPYQLSQFPKMEESGLVKGNGRAEAAGEVSDGNSSTDVVPSSSAPRKTDANPRQTKLSFPRLKAKEGVVQSTHRLEFNSTNILDGAEVRKIKKSVGITEHGSPYHTSSIPDKEFNDIAEEAERSSYFQPSSQPHIDTNHTGHAGEEHASSRHTSVDGADEQLQREMKAASSSKAVSSDHHADETMQDGQDGTSEVEYEVPRPLLDSNPLFRQTVSSQDIDMPQLVGGGENYASGLESIPPSPNVPAPEPTEEWRRMMREEEEARAKHDARAKAWLAKMQQRERTAAAAPAVAHADVPAVASAAALAANANPQVRELSSNSEESEEEEEEEESESESSSAADPANRISSQEPSSSSDDDDSSDGSSPYQASNDQETSATTQDRPQTRLNGPPSSPPEMPNPTQTCPSTRPSLFGPPLPNTQSSLGSLRPPFESSGRVRPSQILDLDELGVHFVGMPSLQQQHEVAEKALLEMEAAAEARRIELATRARPAKESQASVNSTQYFTVPEQPASAAVSQPANASTQSATQTLPHSQTAQRPIPSTAQSPQTDGAADASSSRRVHRPGVAAKALKAKAFAARQARELDLERQRALAQRVWNERQAEERERMKRIEEARKKRMRHDERKAKRICGVKLSPHSSDSEVSGLEGSESDGDDGEEGEGSDEEWRRRQEREREERRRRALEVARGRQLGPRESSAVDAEGEDD